VAAPRLTARHVAAAAQAFPGKLIAPGMLTVLGTPGATAATLAHSRNRSESGVAAWRVLRRGSFCDRHNM
jgi:hypothetical protein